MANAHGPAAEPKVRKSIGEAEGHGEMGCGIQVQQDPEIAISVVTVLELRTGSRAPIRRSAALGGNACRFTP
jgi:hypothetical protein